MAYVNGLRLAYRRPAGKSNLRPPQKGIVVMLRIVQFVIGLRPLSNWPVCQRVSSAYPGQAHTCPFVNMFSLTNGPYTCTIFPRIETQASISFSGAYPQTLYREGLKLGPGLYYFCFNGKRRRGPLARVHSRTRFLTSLA